MASQDVDTSRTLKRMRDLETRKLAAAKTFEDNRRAGQRETWRKRKQQQRLKAKQIRTIHVNECEPKSDSRNLQKDKRFQQLFGETTPVSEHKENVVRADLISLSKDRRAPASARVTALRTLAEMDGHIGKLQHTAGDTSDQPLATMTREQLEKELARLRAQAASRDV